MQRRILRAIKIRAAELGCRGPLPTITLLGAFDLPDFCFGKRMRLTAHCFGVFEQT